MDELIARLVNVLAHIEAYIDFPDEDLPAEDQKRILADLDDLLAGTNRLISTSHYGDLLREGIKTVILGEPNAGKSSLLNRLVGRDRALVSPEPGTTRDYIEEHIVVGAHSLRLIDTAGLNEAPTSLEKRGIEKTLEQAASADLFLWVIDSSHPRVDLQAALTQRLNSSNTIVVLNKCDLLPAPVPTLSQGFCQVKLSALHGTGCDELPAAIVKLADSFQPSVGNELIAINARHAHALSQAAQGLIAARGKFAEGVSGELVASDLRGTLDAYGQISGKIDNEKVLDRLFSTFCIGK